MQSEWRRSGSQKTIVLAIAFVLLWNSGFIGAKYGLLYTAPFTLLFWRYLALTALLFLYLLMRNRFRRVSWGTATPHLIVGVLAHGVWLSGVLLALDREVPAGIVALVVALQPLATGAFSGMVNDEYTPLYRWWGLIIGFGGVVLTVLSRIDFSNTASVVGHLIPLGSVIAITAATLIQRRLEVKDGKHGLPIDLSLFYQCLATVLVLLFPAVAVEKLSTQWTAEFIYTMIWLILAVSLGAYALMWRLIERINATRVASLFYLGPPVTMLMAWLAFGEKLLLTDIVGLIVVFIGVTLTQVKPRKKS